MKSRILLVAASVVFLLQFSSCSTDSQKKGSGEKADTINVREARLTFPAWQDSSAIDDEGIVGIFEVPEMLSLCIMDSTGMKDVASRVKHNFALLNNDLTATGVGIEKYQGIIYYNNDPKNFKFECFTLIDKMPVKKPAHSQVVVLESARMLVYNYYGPYQNTFNAYEEIKKYCEKEKLVQTGQLREMYPISQVSETDPEKWLTRIMMPVASIEKK